METRAHYVLIGSFALAIFAGAFLFVLWLGQLEIDKEFDYYDVVFNDPVTGLSVSGDVRFNGIKVGEVDELSLNENDAKQVIARIRVSGGAPVKEDTIAQLELAGLTGVSFIQLSGGSAESPRLQRKAGQGVPVITATPSEFQRLLTEGGDIIDSVNNAVLRISDLLSEENAENVAATLANVRQVTEALATREAQIASLIDNAAAAGQNLERVTTDLAHMSSQADALMQGDVTRTIGEVEAAAEAARQMFEEADKLIDENGDALTAFAEQGLGQAGGAMVEARRLMAALERLATAVERDPARFLLGQRYPEYEEPAE